MEEFSYEKRIYYHDTDCGGVVYYANYLKHFEEARTELFAGKGIDLKGLAEKEIFFVVARVEIDYRAPARYQDTLRISTRIEKVRLAALRFSQRVHRNGSLIAEAKTTLVCVGSHFKPQPIPEEIRRVLSEDSLQ